MSVKFRVREEVEMKVGIEIEKGGCEVCEIGEMIICGAREKFTPVT